MKISALALLLTACAGGPPAATQEPAPPRALRCPSPRPTDLPAEPRRELDQLEDALREYAGRNGGFPVASVDTGAGPGRRACPALVDLSAWQASPWKELGFTPRAGHVFYYAYNSDGRVVTIAATTDVGCDGKNVLIYMTVGDMNDGAPWFTHRRPAHR